MTTSEEERAADAFRYYWASIDTERGSFGNARDDFIAGWYAALSTQERPRSAMGEEYGSAWTTYPTERAGEAVQRPAVRRVVCAAIRAADGDVMVGIRHYSRDMHAQMHARGDGAKFAHRHDEDQGFVDQFGVYMSREEAYRVAFDNDQIIRPKACGEGLDGSKLYSEGLY
jgi:hypothetical protein